MPQIIESSRDATMRGEVEETTKKVNDHDKKRKER